MITFIGKDELQPDEWQELRFVRPFGGLMFDVYNYNIGGTIYEKDCPEAREAYDKEMMWCKLQNTKRSNLEILKDFAKVAKEIEDNKLESRRLRNVITKRLK